MSGFVYMMSDKPRGVIYTGVTSDLHGRVWEHRNEVRKGYTSKYNAKYWCGLKHIRTSFSQSSGRSR
ncbi:MAG: GIY-YIG nuclease family protein [Allorhizobium sp.]